MGKRWVLAVWVLGVVCLLGGMGLAQGRPAAKPLFRDPVHDGAADPTLIWNRARHEWWMFYTNRRADMATDDPKDVSWFHATRIGIAVSKGHGNSWTYKGEASIPYGDANYTHWAPDIVWADGAYHMFLTVVPGTFKTWNAPREIVQFTSPDLEKWTLVGKLDLGSERVIDPSLFRMKDGVWRVWFKDEAKGSRIFSSDSKDLKSWSAETPAITNVNSEGPKIFEWKGSYWMIVDRWKGLGVYRSSDLSHWEAQKEFLLATPGTMATDRNIGHHCDVVVHGDHAYIFYFTHQMGPDADPKLPHTDGRTVLQVSELWVKDGVMGTDRDKPVVVDLGER